VGKETVYTKHQILPQTSKHYKQSSLHSSVTRNGWGFRRCRQPRRYPGPSRSRLPPRGQRFRGLPFCLDILERRLLLSWAKAGKDSKESRKATRSEGDDLEEVLLARSCAMEGEDVE